MNEILVNVLDLYVQTMQKSTDSTRWILDNQMWIYPVDGNYVIYAELREEDSFSFDVFLANENITITFDTLESINAFIKNPIISVYLIEKNSEMDKIREKFADLINLIKDEIYKLPEEECDKILDMSKTPNDNYSLFLDHSYTQLNDLLQEYNKLEIYFKKEALLNNSTIPKYFYDTAYCGKRNDDGILILSKEFDEDE